MVHHSAPHFSKNRRGFCPPVFLNSFLQIIWLMPALVVGKPFCRKVFLLLYDVWLLREIMLNPQKRALNIAPFSADFCLRWLFVGHLTGGS